MFDVGFPVSRLSLDFSVIPCVPYNTKHVALTYSHVEVRIRLNFKRFVIQKKPEPGLNIIIQIILYFIVKWELESVTVAPIEIKY